MRAFLFSLGKSEADGRRNSSVGAALCVDLALTVVLSTRGQHYPQKAGGVPSK